MNRPAPTVLLVEDDASVRESICRVLGAEAIQAVAARGVKDALEHIQRHTPDLVITDMCMAPLAGWDLIAYLGSRHPRLPIFVITALPLPLAGDGLHEVDAFFQKPLNLDALVAAIRRQLNIPGSRQGAALAQS